MRRICAFPGCKSGTVAEMRKNKSCGKPNPKFFKVPPETCPRRKQWERIIGRKVKDFHVLCELHFARGDIVDKFVTTLSNGETHTMDRSVVTLKSTAIPLELGADGISRLQQSAGYDCSPPSKNSSSLSSSGFLLVLADGSSKMDPTEAPPANNTLENIKIKDQNEDLANSIKQETANLEENFSLTFIKEETADDGELVTRDQDKEDLKETHFNISIKQEPTDSNKLTTVEDEEYKDLTATDLSSSIKQEICDIDELTKTEEQTNTHSTESYFTSSIKVEKPDCQDLIFSGQKTIKVEENLRRRPRDSLYSAPILIKKNRLK